VRGVHFSWKARVVFPTYHPAAALYNPRLLEVLRKDFSRISGITEILK
jgi:DNA polymerase